MLTLAGALHAFAEGPPALPALKSGRARITEEVKSGGRVWVTAVFWVDADLDATFRTLRDIERHPEFMPHVKATRILSVGPGYHVVHIEAGDGHINIGGLVPDFVTRYLVKQTVPAMVVNVRKRVESGGVWQSDEYRSRQ